MDDYRNNFSGEDRDRIIHDVNFVLIDDDQPSQITKRVKKEKKRFTFSLTRGGLALLVMVCLLTSTIFGFGGAMLADNLKASSSFGTRADFSTAGDESGVTKTKNAVELSTDSDLTVEEIAALNANSVVEIKTESVATDNWMQQYVTEGAGSGVIISADGYIVTNNHVIEGSNKITVTLKNGSSYTASLVGRDDETDLAVLKIKASGLTPVVYGDSSKLSVGDLAVVIGNPLGSLGGTVTAGIVSALDRSITIDGKTMSLLQTDASINPGNSGGGMFNGSGELVGIIVAKSAGSNVEGLGFAIPVNKVKEIAQELADYGYVRGRIDTGLTFVDLTSMRNAIYYGVKSLGIYVKSVDTMLAKESGFKSGDMIYYVEDKQIETADDLTSAFSGYSVGDKVKVTVIRGNATKELTLTLGEKTAE